MERVPALVKTYRFLEEGLKRREITYSWLKEGSISWGGLCCSYDDSASIGRSNSKMSPDRVPAISFVLLMQIDWMWCLVGVVLLRIGPSYTLY